MMILIMIIMIVITTIRRRRRRRKNKMSYIETSGVYVISTAVLAVGVPII